MDTRHWRSKISCTLSNIKRCHSDLKNWSLKIWTDSFKSTSDTAQFSATFQTISWSFSNTELLQRHFALIVPCYGFSRLVLTYLCDCPFGFPEAVVRRCSVKRCSAILLKKSLWHRCFPVNFVKFLRTTFLQNISGDWF